MPPFEPTIGEYTLAGNAFFAGALFPGLALTPLRDATPEGDPNEPAGQAGLDRNASGYRRSR